MRKRNNLQFIWRNKHMPRYDLWSSSWPVCSQCLQCVYILRESRIPYATTITIQCIVIGLEKRRNMRLIIERMPLPNVMFSATCLCYATDHLLNNHWPNYCVDISETVEQIHVHLFGFENTFPLDSVEGSAAAVYIKASFTYGRVFARALLSHRRANS